MQVAESKREPTEKTPKGYEVRVPKRREFFSNLKKIAGGKPSEKPSRKDDEDPPPPLVTFT
jgi:hypothetical protein